MTKFTRCERVVPKIDYEGCAQALGISLEEAKVRVDASLAEDANTPLYVNDVYQVLVREQGDGQVWLSIKRLDKEPIHDWRDLQAIKNELVGPECEGLELYPAESRKVDSANQYHLWVMTDPTFRIPFGFNAERFVTDAPVEGTKQRPL